MELILSTAFAAAVVRLTVTLAIAAMGETVLERSGVINVGIEGLMLVGAFGAVWGAQLMDSTTLGVVTAVVAATAGAGVIGFLALSLRLDQIIVGIVFTLLAIGLTSYLRAVVLPDVEATTHELSAVAVPVLSEIPILGEALFRQSALVYVVYTVIAVTAWWLAKSKGGLLVRAVGDDPATVDFSGYNVLRIRYAAFAFAGATAGVAGALVSLGSGGVFLDNMTGGRGWIALIAVMLGAWRPLTVVAACALFGIGDALQFRLQTVGSDLPPELFFALPYILALVVLLVIRRRTEQPATLGVAYERT